MSVNDEMTPADSEGTPLQILRENLHLRLHDPSGKVRKRRSEGNSGRGIRYEQLYKIKVLYKKGEKKRQEKERHRLFDNDSHATLISPKSQPGRRCSLHRKSGWLFETNRIEDLV